MKILLIEFAEFKEKQEALNENLYIYKYIHSGLFLSILYTTFL